MVARNVGRYFLGKVMSQGHKSLGSLCSVVEDPIVSGKGPRDMQSSY